MPYEAKVVGRKDIPEDRCIVLDHAHLQGKDYSNRELVQFCTIGCLLERCQFDEVRIENAQFGSGLTPSEFVECSFDGARMEMGPGGYARFVRCSFRNVDLCNWMCLAVELIDCIFSGKLQSAIFNGTVPEEKRAILGRNRNEFYGNDFSSLNLIDVTFRTGIDLRQQRLPAGSQYLYLPDAAEAIRRARLVLVDWQQNTEFRRVALAIVDALQKDVESGQRQMLLRQEDYFSHSAFPHEAVDKVFSSLRIAVP